VLNKRGAASSRPLALRRGEIDHIGGGLRDLVLCHGAPFTGEIGATPLPLGGDLTKAAQEGAQLQVAVSGGLNEADVEFVLDVVDVDPGIPAGRIFACNP
jgi:hypothetical protein